MVFSAFSLSSVILVLCAVASLPLVTCTDDVSLQSLATLVQQQASTIQSLQAKVTSLEATVQQTTAVNQQQSNAIARFDKRVFFTAHMGSSQVTIGSSNQPILFDAVLTNIGNAYDPQTGVFTAPVSGVYVVYAQLMKADTHGTIHYEIDKAGTTVCLNSVEGANDYDMSSCLATTHVQQGQTVYVRRNGGDVALQGDWYCSFSGFLVSPDP